MFNPNVYEIQAAYRHDMERAARKSAQLAQIRDTQPNKQLPHAVALAKVGDMLVSVGCRLQERYGTFMEEASHTPAKAC